jgi:SAM-dependent methyltransferase
MARCLNLGCGHDKRVSEADLEWVNLDRVASDGVQVVADLENPLPFTDGEFDLVYASHVLEHVHNYIPLILEIHRVLRPGGTFIAYVPCFPCRAAVADPTHVRYFVPESFFHLCKRVAGFPCHPLIDLFELRWIETFPLLDDHDFGVPGSWLTNLHVELEKKHEDAHG